MAEMGSNETWSRAKLSRRAWLGAVGAAAVSPAVTGTALADDGDYGNVVDIVDAGADNSGQEPIDDIFHEHAEDDTLIRFQEGTYKVNRLGLYGLTHFAMVGDSATLVPGGNYDESWISGMADRDVRIENFTLDTSGDGVHPEVDINADDGLVVRNIHKKGFHDQGGVALGFHTNTSDGTAFLENIHATDGGESVGIYVQSEGPVTVRNCHVAGFQDNGLYASRGESPVEVEGGSYWNNGVAQVRLGSADSSVRNADIGVDRHVPEDEDTINMRGIRIAEGPGPVTIENCDIWMKGAEGSGGIVGAFSGGSFNVRDTRIYIDENYTTIGSDGSRTSYGIFVDNATDAPTGEQTIENTSITGGGTLRSAVLIRRDNTTIRECCIQQSGDRRNGLIFENSDSNEVSNSTINVTNERFVLRESSVRRANNSAQGSCPAPGESTHKDTKDDDGKRSEEPSVGEVGKLSNDHTVAGEWTAIDLGGAFDSPVAIAKPMSYNGPDPAHVRLRDVTGDGFAYRFEEWMYLDDDHWFDRADFLAIDEGTYNLGDLSTEVGRVETTHEFTEVEFEQGFDGAPVVFAQPQTYNGSNPIVSRLRGISSGSAEIRLQEEEGEEHGGWHRVEEVGYVALTPGSGVIQGRPAEVGTTGDKVTDSWHEIPFEGTYDDPRFVADIQSYNGGKTANLRYRNLTGSSVEVSVEEEQSADESTNHRPENVGYLVVEGA